MAVPKEKKNYTLAEIQQKLKAPKGQFNSFGKYKYRNCEDILEALKPLLGENTVTLTDEILQVGNRFYVKATATFYASDTADKFTNVTAYAREAEVKKGMDESQITGAASSYARKYALNGLFLIDDNRDADSDESPKDEKISYATGRKVPEMNATNDAHGLDIEEQFVAEEKADLLKEQIKAYLGVLKVNPLPSNVKKITGLTMEPKNFQTISEKLRAKIEAADLLTEAFNSEKDYGQKDN